MNEEKQELWAIIELFGHARIAGRVSEQTIGGQSFVRVDVPEVRWCIQDGYRNNEATSPTEHVIAAHTRSFGAGAIYAINWCDERAARLAAQSIRDQPIDPYSLKQALASMSDRDRQRLLAGPVTELVGGEQDGEGGDEIPY